MSEWSLPQLLAGLHEDIQKAARNCPTELRPSWCEGRREREGVAGTPTNLSATALSGGHGACRRQPRQVQRADRHRGVRPTVLAVHLQLFKGRRSFRPKACTRCSRRNRRSMRNKLPMHGRRSQVCDVYTEPVCRSRMRREPIRQSRSSQSLVDS